MKKREKRAEFPLAGNAITFIIAVICILFLFLVIFRFLAIKNTESEIDRVEESLNKIADYLKESKSEVRLTSPENWKLISWNKNKGEVPIQCQNLLTSSCLCFCKEIFIKTNELKECNANSVCIDSQGYSVSSSSFFGDFIYFRNPPFKLKLNHEEKTINEF